MKKVRIVIVEEKKLASLQRRYNNNPSKQNLTKLADFILEFICYNNNPPHYSPVLTIYRSGGSRGNIEMINIPVATVKYIELLPLRERARAWQERNRE